MVGLIDHLGRRSLRMVEYGLDLWMVFYLSLRSVILNRAQSVRTILGVIASQIYFTGVQALPLISVLGLAAGTIVILQSSAQLTLVGGGEMIGNLLVAIVVRELGPALTAFVVIARSGTAVASEIGTMKVNREFDALQIMGIHPLSFIVFPRVVGGILSVLCLSLYFDLVALGGGYFITRFLREDMPLVFYLESVIQAIAFEDVWLFFVKNTFSGAMIFVVCCYQGMLVQQSPHEVPQMTTRAVLNSMICVVAFNLMVTTLFYLNQLLRLGIL